MEVIRVAKVINNNDPDHTGKVKIRVLPEMFDLLEEKLPWVSIYAQGTGTSQDTGNHIVLENNTFIRVIIEDWPLFDRVRYISDDYIEGQYIYDSFEDVEIDELGTQTYPQPNFKRFKDGTIEFHNSVSGEHGVYFKGGEYFIRDSSGNIFINTLTKEIKAYNNNGYISLKPNGNIELNGNTKNLVTHAELDSALQIVINWLLAHVHPGVQTGSGSTGTVVAPLVYDISSSKTNTILVG